MVTKMGQLNIDNHVGQFFTEYRCQILLNMVVSRLFSYSHEQDFQVCLLLLPILFLLCKECFNLIFLPACSYHSVLIFPGQLFSLHLSHFVLFKASLS